ncbi:MAG: response regulator transcription factor [Bacteroidetes bacterium]|nr:response regulator transcription factor [Bacteroidota bacterium]
MEKKIRVFIVDDHSIFRKGLRMQLKEIKIAELIGEAADGKELLEFIESNSEIDIILLDIKMPVMTGIEAATIIKSKFPNIKIIGLSMFDDEEYFQNLLEAGAEGYLLKNVGKEELERAIISVYKGNNYYSTEMFPILTKKFTTKKDHEEIEIPENLLSKRELEILQLITEGHTNHEIAEILFISQRTVDGHRNNILSKTGAKNTVSMVTAAIKNKWVQIPTK